MGGCEPQMQEIETGNFATSRWVFCPPDSIRVVSWNINRGLRLQRVIEFLASAKADLVLLQESDLNARRTHHVNIAKEISQKLQMNYVFGREFQELTQGSRASPAYHGQATLSRWPLSNSLQERLGGRLALVSAANIAGKTIVTYNLHLESKGDDELRRSQLGEALEDARRYDWNTPAVLAGDFNLDVSGGDAASAITRAQFKDAFANQHAATTPHSLLEQGQTIDWIFTRGPIRSIEPQVLRSISASDHYPLSITLAFT